GGGGGGRGGGGGGRAMNAPKTIGLLYMGEMGAAFAAMLASRGARIVTTLRDRSDATAERCQVVPCTVLDSPQELIAQSDIVLSVVPPDAAEDLADLYCALAHHAPANAMFIDLNSISPEVAS